MKYLLLVLKHKWFVLLAGLRLRVPLWRLLLHDWTKLRPSELVHYNRQFFGRADDPAGFARCWLRHQNRNPHHWEYWICRTGHSSGAWVCADNEPLPMPEWAVREMVADWMGAARAYEGNWPSINSWSWFETNRHRLRLHCETSRTLVRILREIGYAGRITL